MPLGVPIIHLWESTTILLWMHSRQLYLSPNGEGPQTTTATVVPPEHRWDTRPPTNNTFQQLPSSRRNRRLQGEKTR